MGTPEQKARRAAYISKLEKALRAMKMGRIRGDEDLRSFLDSIGGGNPLYNQLYSGGGFSLYGPSWNPGMISDFEHNQEIMRQGPGEEWYDPSKPENWKDTDPLKAARMSGFFKWRDENMDMINRDFGGNALAAWYTLRNKSNKPNSPDMSWWNEGTGKDVSTGQTPTSRTEYLDPLGRPNPNLPYGPNNWQGWGTFDSSKVPGKAVVQGISPLGTPKPVPDVSNNLPAGPVPAGFGTPVMPSSVPRTPTEFKPRSVPTNPYASFGLAGVRR